MNRYHNKQYGAGYDPLALAAKCINSDRQCEAWAKAGKCDTDPTMTGLTGRCRLACSDCVQCPRDDVICLRRNMRSLRAASKAKQKAGS